MLRNKFLSICNSHRILVAMMMTIESGKDIFVLFFYISKCNWLVFVLKSGCFARQPVLSKFRLRLSLHSPRNGTQSTEWVLLRFSSAGRASTAWCRTQTKIPIAVGSWLVKEDYSGAQAG